MERKRLDETQLEENLKVVIGWAIKDEKLTKTYEFKSYLQGLVFATALGYRAEKMDHHPDITVSYRKVTVAVNTHDVGGISHLDFELAREADGLFAA